MKGIVLHAESVYLGVVFWWIFYKDENKNKNSEEENLMRPQTAYVSKRGAVATGSSSWSRNHNTVRHTAKPLGMVSYMVMLGMIVLGIGLIYVGQGTQATNYDYELSRIEGEITELEAKREDLAVEKARLTSIEAAETSTVAASMEDGAVAGYASN